MTSYLSPVLIYLFALASIAQAAPSLDFNRDVRPILSDKCYRCHGPDADNQKSDFRLHNSKDALADLGGYAGIVPGDLEASELHWRIWEEDTSEVMPPPKSKLSLSDEEKRTLDRWIKSGATYDKHWSFKVIAKPALPKLSRTDRRWTINEIDHFIVDRLKEEKLKPSAQAEKTTLIRRVSLDLTGLPPSLEEVDEFLNDDAPNAWERVVDRLLASPHYGERMALVWLDAARYADSGGYQNDIKRSQWPWRDWVIRSYNANIPFDQFTIEQLAGDLLPDPTDDQLLATAFNRNHRINNEGGIIAQEYLVEYVADRVETTSTVWLGLTMTCARCHDHKYDPIKQKDFYKMFAFFYNIPENGRDGNLAPVPNMTIYTKGSEEEHQQLKENVATTTKELKTFPEENQERFDEWIQAQLDARSESFTPLSELPSASLHFPFDAIEGKNAVNARDAKRKGVLRGRGKDPTLKDKTTFGAGVLFGRSGYVSVAKPHTNGFDANQARSWVVQLHIPKAFAGSEGPILVAAEKDTLRGYRLMLEDTGKAKTFRISFQLMEDTQTKNGIEVQSPPVVLRDAPVRLGVTWTGSGKAAGVHLFVDGKPVETIVVLDALDGAAKTNTALLIGARSEKDAKGTLRDATFLKGIIDDVQIYDVALDESQIALISATDPQDLLLANLSKDAKNYLQTAWSKTDLEGKALIATLKKHKSTLATFEKNSITRVSIMEEMPKARQTYLLTRGAYDQPDESEELKPNTPGALPSMSESMPKKQTRSGPVARWS